MRDLLLLQDVEYVYDVSAVGSATAYVCTKHIPT